MLITRYIHDVTNTLQVRQLDDASLVYEVQLPFLGSVAGSSGDRELDEFFFKMVGKDVGWGRVEEMGRGTGCW